MQRPKKGVWSEWGASFKALGQELTLHDGEKSEQGAGREEMRSDPGGGDPAELGFLQSGEWDVIASLNYMVLQARL